MLPVIHGYQRQNTNKPSLDKQRDEREAIPKTEKQVIQKRKVGSMVMLIEANASPVTMNE